MRKFLDSTKSTFVLLAAVTFAANLVLMFWAGRRPVVIVCAAAYVLCWILFFRADLLLRWKEAVTPLVMTTGVLLALWLVCAVIGVLHVEALAAVQSVLLSIFLYSMSPVLLLAVNLGQPMDVVTTQMAPVFFGFFLLLRLAIRAALKSRFNS